MKTRIKNFCVWFLTKYYPPIIKNILVTSDKYSFEFGGYLPDDENWHHTELSLSLWLKRAKRKKRHDILFDKVGLYTDGRLKARYQFDVPAPTLKEKKVKRLKK